ncbi:acyltransferase family protein [Sphingobium aromaticiconvertens]|uniref:acyltransferase family protein n=1 Tax=Sphingobium aromaticiconvertens TaxID=365341 RepID=UPI0030176A4C
MLDNARPVVLPAGGSASTYRADVDGLRAIAVIVIILFHAELAPFAGGFVGVDIFFVISGYLITRLIMADIDHGDFSIITFYKRRVRRLFPALFAMLAVTLVAGVFLLLPRDLASLGRNITGTTLFVSNFFFWEQAGYFEGDAHYKPLLHTWSLAVEEQYYIVYPLLLSLLKRWWPHSVKSVMLALTLLSFFGAVLMMRIDPSAAFYLAPFRAWELLLGALIALRVFPVLPARLTGFFSLSGAILIAGSVLLYSDLTPFPGISALVPCLGTALILYAGEHAKPAINRLLAQRPIVFIGLISYSVYLWHWPIFVFVRYYAIEKLTTLESLGLLLFSLAVGALSWRTIEMPFRKSRNWRIRTPILRLASGVMALSIFAGGSIYAANGLPDRFPKTTQRLSDYALSMNPEADMCADVELQLRKGSPCTIGPRDQAQLFLWGDSHAGALFGAMQVLAKEGKSTIYGATPRCPPLLGLGTDAACIAGNQKRLDYVLSHPEIDTVILAARWSLYLEGRMVEGPAETNGNLPRLFDATGHEYEPFTRDASRHFRYAFYALVKRLLLADKKVVLLYPVPETGYDIPSTLARINSQGGNPAAFTISRDIYDRRQSEALRLLDQLGRRRALYRVYPEDALCNRTDCVTSVDGRPLYFDSHHLSIPGARILLPQIRAALH